MTFIKPNYLDYTYFTPVMRIVLAELADKRNLYVVRFRIAKTRYEKVMSGEGHISQADLHYKHMQDYLEVISEIDQAVREIYFLHGRLN